MACQLREDTKENKGKVQLL
jgi:hypothetical protein